MKTEIISARFNYREVKDHRYISNKSQIEYIDAVKRKIINTEFRLVSQLCFCGGNDDTIIAKIDRYNLPVRSVICGQCGTLRIDPYFDSNAVVDFYSHYYQKMYGRSDDKQGYFEKQRLYGKKILKVIEGLGISAKNVLEVGCGAGGALLEFQEKGIESFGCEYDAGLAEYGAAKGVKKIFIGSIEDLIKTVRDKKFDLIFTHHVLEHIVDVHTFFANCKALLHKSGTMIHIVPDIFSLSMRHSSHGDLLSMIHIAHKFNFSIKGFQSIALKNNLTLEILAPPEYLLTHMSKSPEIWARFDSVCSESTLTAPNAGSLRERLKEMEREFIFHQRLNLTKKRLSKILGKLKSLVRNPFSMFRSSPEKNSVREDVEIPLTGYESNRNKIPFVDNLSDSDLVALNNILDWKAFVADANGRRFGRAAWAGKRVVPQPIPDPRHLLLNSRINLFDKTLLEIGCFEGIHTVSLCDLANRVIAIDSRIENVVKTVVRSSLFGKRPTVFKCDVEVWDAPKAWLKADVCHHIGVLYHLKDPVSHLRVLATLVKDAVFLDTHIALPTDRLEEYTVEGQIFRYKKYLEGGQERRILRHVRSRQVVTAGGH